jgi:hypothetical protein
MINVFVGLNDIAKVVKMRAISKRAFLLLVLLVCGAGLGVASLTSWTVNLILPIRLSGMYQQLANYGESSGKMLAEVKLNHTMILLNDSVTTENYLVLTQESLRPNVRAEISFGDLRPRLIDGNLSWTGSMTLNESKTLYCLLAFDVDGTYEMRSDFNATSSDGGCDGVHVVYRITVQDGKITEVADEDGLALAPRNMMSLTYPRNFMCAPDLWMMKKLTDSPRNVAASLIAQIPCQTRTQRILLLSFR